MEQQSSPRSRRSFTLELPDGQATYRLGQQLGQHLPAGSVILLVGQLGSGKTTLVKGLGHALGITDTIDSPTFTLINEYLDGRLPLYHIDLYRLSPAETAGLFLETYWTGLEVEPGILAIEWAEHLLESPPQALKIALLYTEAGGRQAKLTVPATAFSTLLEVLNADEILAHEV